MLLAATYLCPACGEPIETTVDPSQGPAQRYVEDCQVCCRPLLLEVRVRGRSAEVTAVPEGG